MIVLMLNVLGLLEAVGLAFNLVQGFANSQANLIEECRTPKSVIRYPNGGELNIPGPPGVIAERSI